MTEEAVAETVKSVIEAYAAEGGAIWQIVLIVFTVVGTPLIGLAFFYLRKLWAKTGIELHSTLWKFIWDQADSVIDQVESWAAKKEANGNKLTSKAKLTKGIELLGAILGSAGVLKKLEVNLEHVLEERLKARGET